MIVPVKISPTRERSERGEDAMSHGGDPPARSLVIAVRRHMSSTHPQVHRGQYFARGDPPNKLRGLRLQVIRLRLLVCMYGREFGCAACDLGLLRYRFAISLMYNLICLCIVLYIGKGMIEWNINGEGIRFCYGLDSYQDLL